MAASLGLIIPHPALTEPGYKRSRMILWIRSLVDELIGCAMSLYSPSVAFLLGIAMNSPLSPLNYFNVMNDKAFVKSNRSYRFEFIGFLAN